MIEKLIIPVIDNETRLPKAGMIRCLIAKVAFSIIQV
jgi:hypothetical protein